MNCMMQRNNTRKDDEKKNFINIRGCVTFNYVFGLLYEREGCKSIIYYNYYNNNNDIGQFSTTTNNYNQ